MVNADLEQSIKNVKTVVKESKPVLMRISASPLLRRMAFLTLCALFAGTFAGVVTYLQYQVQEHSQKRIKEVRKTGNILQYKTVIEIIDSCLDSKEGKSQKEWYCEQAALHYRNFENKLPPNRMQEVLAKNLHRAMRVDMTNLLRTIELDQVIEAEAAKEERYLELLLSSSAMWTFIVLFFMTMIGFLLLMQHFTKQQALPEIRLPEGTGTA